MCLLRILQVMLQMTKIVIADLQKAYMGNRMWPKIGASTLQSLGGNLLQPTNNHARSND